MRFGLSTFLFLLVFLFLFAAKGVAQEKNFSVTAAPVLLPFQTFTIQPGVQYRFSDRWAAALELCFATAPEKRTAFDKTRFFRISGELKRYLSTRRNLPYVSIQSAYSSRLLVRNDSGYFYQKQNIIWYRNAEIHSPLLAFALKFGVEIKITGSVYLDLFIGMGSRTIFNRYEAAGQRAAPIPLVSDRNMFATIPAYSYNYTLTRFHAPVGLRLGVRI